tara:strand:- start:104 stop:295 length:192 start_codon:yes stop_codon:yes gene_type:complete
MILIGSIQVNIKYMRKQREYKGCELESPIYRQIIAEKRDNSGLHSTMSMPINEYNPKRGKHKL